MALRIAVNDELNALAGLLREIAAGAETVVALPSPAAREGVAAMIQFGPPGEGGVGRRPPRLRERDEGVATSPSPPASRDPLPQAGEGMAGGAARPGPANVPWLNPDARIAIISFHSLEDRLVKHAFADLAARGLATPLSRKPIVANEDELAANPRSRSAKLRAVALRGP